MASPIRVLVPLIGWLLRLLFEMCLCFSTLLVITGDMFMVTVLAAVADFLFDTQCAYATGDLLKLSELE